MGLKLSRCLDAMSVNEKGRGWSIWLWVGTLTAVIAGVRPNDAVFGVDISRSALALATRRYPRVPFVMSDVTKLPLRSESFDYVLGLDILEHVRDRKRCWERYAG